jgi:pyruvate/2-oxoglutarate dehydrogenase complex dihydrolipoamide acyltransferase (E2) component
MSQNGAFDDTTIPVLTEVVQDKSPATASAPATAEAAAPAPAAVAEVEERAAASLSEQDWSLLERRIAERMLQQLQNRVDFVLEQRLRDSMADVLQHALAGLTDAIRTGLQETIEKIVVRAVAQEVAHLQTLKK